MSTGTESTAATAGLRGVVAAQSAIGDVNGEEGNSDLSGLQHSRPGGAFDLRRGHFFALERAFAELPMSLPNWKNGFAEITTCPPRSSRR